MNKIKNKTTALLTTILLLTSLNTPMHTYANTKIHGAYDETNLYASELIATYFIDIANKQGIIQIGSMLSSPYDLDEISIKVELQYLLNNRWDTLQTFNNIKYKSYSYATKNEYPAIAGMTFRAKATYTVQQGNKTEQRTLYSDNLKIN